MKVTVMESLGISLLGFALVFVVLVILMIVIKLMNKIMEGKSAQGTADMDTNDSEPEFARGSCGDVNLYDVPDRTAAMLMAIVADKLGKPLNTLRFISIREVEGDK